MTKTLVQVLAGLILALSGSTAQATIIIFAYSAAGELGGTVTGVFGYNDSIADTAPASDQGFYPSAGFFSGTISGGLQDGVTFNRASVDVQTSNDREVFNGFEDHFGINDLSSGTFIEFVSNSSNPPPTAPLDSDALASSALVNALLDPANWSFVVLLVVEPEEFQLRYDLTSVRLISEVPGPGTLTLLALGSSLVYRRLKRRPSSP